MASATPDLRLPSQPQNITAFWLVLNYTAWWTEAHVCKQLAQGCYLAVPQLGTLIQLKSAEGLAPLTARTLNWLCQYANSSGNKACCYAELVISSLVVMTVIIASTFSPTCGKMASLSWPGCFGWVLRWQISGIITAKVLLKESAGTWTVQHVVNDFISELFWCCFMHAAELKRVYCSVDICSKVSMVLTYRLISSRARLRELSRKRKSLTVK